MGNSSAGRTVVSTCVSNSYVKVPSELEPEELLKDIHSYLEQACGRDPKLAKDLDMARVRYRKGEEWICLYEVGFTSMEESNIVEVLRTITQKYVDEVVMLNCFGVVSSGAYGHFVEGVLVRFITACDFTWGESIGAPESWESQLISQMGGLHDITITELGKRLHLGDVANHSLVWDIDLPVNK